MAAPEPAPEVTAEWTARPPDGREDELARLLFGDPADREDSE